MAAGAWIFPDASRKDLLNGAQDLDTNTYLYALFLSTSNIGAASTTYAGATNEHANQGAPGYVTGGFSLGTLDLTGTTTVKVTDAASPAWTATGGNITAKFGVLYKSGGNIVCYHLLDSGGADVTATTGNTFTVTFDANGIFTLA